MATDRTFIRKESAVYAQVLLEATQAAGTTFEVAGQLDGAYEIIRGNIELRTTLLDRMIPIETRIAIINEVFEGFDPVLLAVLDVMLKRDQLMILGKVTETFTNLAEDALKAVFIDVTTVVALDDALRSKIKEKYSAQFGRDVLLREHIDPAIVGGIILSAHGISIDASITTQLEKARHALSQSR